MCGFGGVLRTDGKRILKRWLDVIDTRIAPRGPDGTGRFRDRVTVSTSDGDRVVEVALVHRRLSVIDPHGGAQPMVSERGRDRHEDLVAVVCNGCIYNHAALRRELEAEGHRFTSDHSDTEVLVHGYRQWGPGLPDHLEGMYAYAIWDRGAARLLLGRDWFGQKPLHVVWGEDAGARASLVFASDARATGMIAAELPGVPPPAPDRLCAFLQHGFLSGQGLRLGSAVAPGEIGPGEVWQVDLGGTTVRRVAPRWSDALDEPDDGDDLETRIDRAVARRLEADVPLGCFLSGGVDSSLIAHYASRHQPGLRTFGVRMPDPRFDESRFAQRVADHLGTDHTTLDVSGEPADDLRTLIDRMGQPFADSSILPTHWVSRAARAHVTVALSGDGGDELFVGYERYLAARHLARFAGVLNLVPAGVGRRGHAKSIWRKLRRAADAARDHAPMGLLALESIFTADQIATLLPDAELDLDRLDGGDDPVQALRRHDLDHYLPGDLLRKVDVASMAVALEVRCPFLDRDVVRGATAMSLDELLPGGRRKGWLRHLARRHLPREVADRPKMGFAIPIGQWFRNDFGGMRTLLLDQLRGHDPFPALPLDRTAVQLLINEHLSRRHDHGHRLFALLTLSLACDLE